MNTNTNSEDNLTLVENQIEEESLGYLIIENKKIKVKTKPLHLIYKNLIESSITRISSKDLYNLIKFGGVKSIYLTVTDPIIICLKKTSCNSKKYFKIDFADYVSFQQHYCVSDDTWPKEGF
jgi:hypothetical protein